MVTGARARASATDVRGRASPETFGRFRLGEAVIIRSPTLLWFPTELLSDPTYVYLEGS